jgi:hypothetical protein
MSDNQRSPQRRDYLKYAGSAVIVGLAGCSSDGGDGGGDGDGGDSTPTPTVGGGGGDGGGGGGSGHEVPHPNDGQVPDGEAEGKPLAGGSRQTSGLLAKDSASVGYEHKPNDGQHCGNCSLYVPDANDDGFGACASVAGKIHPCDYCILYTEYTGDNTVACNE